MSANTLKATQTSAAQTAPVGRIHAESAETKGQDVVERMQRERCHFGNQRRSKSCRNTCERQNEA